MLCGEAEYRALMTDQLQQLVTFLGTNPEYSGIKSLDIDYNLIEVSVYHHIYSIIDFWLTENFRTSEGSNLGPSPLQGRCLNHSATGACQAWSLWTMQFRQGVGFPATLRPSPHLLIFSHFAIQRCASTTSETFTSYPFTYPVWSYPDGAIYMTTTSSLDYVDE